MNRLRWQDEGEIIKLRTLTDAVDREGNKIIDHVELKAEGLLDENKFDAKTGMPLDINSVEESVSSPVAPEISKNIIDKSIDECNCGKEEERQIDKTLFLNN